MPQELDQPTKTHQYIKQYSPGVKSIDFLKN